MVKRNATFTSVRIHFLGKNSPKTTFLKLFSCYEKRLHSPFLPLHRQNKEVWVSGLNQHTANVPDRKVPKVRNRLQRVHKPSLLGLCRASGDSQRNPSASALWLVSSVGSEHDATNVGVGSSSLSRVTILELWQTWCMRGTENPENVVRLHEVPLKNSGVLQWQRGRTGVP